MLRNSCSFLVVGIAMAACAATESADECTVSAKGDLVSAIDTVEQRLADGCDYHFDEYFQSLLALAVDNPDRNNPKLFSNHLVRVHESGVISRRQAESLYNRYFSVKFVSLRGDYNTCSQTCPVRSQVMADMRAELHDKELGLLRASADREAYYRSDNLLKEADLVLKATCRACAGGDA